MARPAGRARAVHANVARPKRGCRRRQPLIAIGLGDKANSMIVVAAAYETTDPRSIRR
jgi:hypothetical protein